MSNQSRIFNNTTRYQPFWLLALTIFFYLTAIPVHAMTVTEATKLLASDGEAEDRFGDSVAISGDTAVIGSRNIDNGSAYVFVRNTNGDWSQQAQLFPSDGEAEHRLGSSVAISGNTVALASRINGVYVFIRDSNGGWSQQAKIEQSFTSSVSISGDTLLIGSSSDFTGEPLDHFSNDNVQFSGSASIFVRDSTGIWNQQAKLLPDNGVFSSPSGLNPAIDQFGRSVSISGDTAIIGAPMTPQGSRAGAGAAYIFVRNSDGNWIRQGKFFRSVASRVDRFGSSVSISQNTAIIGVSGALTENGFFTGEALIFDRDNSGVWSQQAILFPDDDENLRSFGSSVAISDNTAIIGADNNGNNGPAYIFTRDSNGDWNQQTKLLPVDDNIGSSFNNTPVSISGDTAIIGAPSDNEKGPEAGAAYVYDLNERTIDPSILIDSGINFVGGPFILSDQFLAQELTLQNDAKITDISLYMFRESGTNPQVIKAQLTSSIGPGTPSSELIEEYSFIIEPNPGLHLVSIPTSLNLTAGTYFLVLSSALEQQGDRPAAWAFRAPEDIGDSFILGRPVNTSFPPDSRISITEESSYSLRISGETITQPSDSCNKSVLLDGINDWIKLPDMDLTSDFTIEAWVKLAPGIDAVDALLGQNGSGPDINFHQQKMRLFIAQSPWDVVTANTPMQANVWTHVAISRSGSTLRLYLDGRLDATGIWAGTLPIKALGRGNRSSQGGFAGEIDEVRIWEIARSSEQINQNYVRSVDPSSAGLLGYWTFNESGQTVTDIINALNGSLGNGPNVSNDDPVQIDSTAPMLDECEGTQNRSPLAVNDSVGPITPGQAITIDVLSNDTDIDGPLALGSVRVETPPTNGTATVDLATGEINYTHDNSASITDSFTYTVEDNEGLISNIAKVNVTISQSPVSCNGSLSLDGSDDWINLPDMSMTDDFTIEAWIKLTPGIDAVDSLLGQEGGGPDINFHLQKVRLFIAASPWDVVIANTATQANSWIHVAITRTGSSLALYINGTLDATGVWTGTLPIKALGRGNRSSQGGFAGEMDEVRLWDIARSAGEINQSYQQSVDPSSTGLLGYWNFNESGQTVMDVSNGLDGSLGSATNESRDDPTRLVSTAPIMDDCEGL